MQIGLGKMAGVARLREETQIRQFQGANGFAQSTDARSVGLPLLRSMEKHRPDKEDSGDEESQAKARFPYG